MTLADACIVIDYQRGKDARLVALADSLPLAVCGSTRSEVLAGARSDADRADTAALLDTFHQQPTPEAVWDKVGDHLARLRAAGLKVPFPDVVLAGLGIHLNVEVWSRDGHFPLMQAVLPGLRLFQELP